VWSHLKIAFVKKKCMGDSEVLTSVLLEMEILWDVTPSHLRRHKSSKIEHSITLIKVCAVVCIKRQIP
jgi:hypothetical protein